MRSTLQRESPSLRGPALIALTALAICSLACASLLPGYNGTCEVASEEDGFYACYDGVDGSDCRAIGRGKANAPEGSPDNWYSDQDCDELGYSKSCDIYELGGGAQAASYEVGSTFDTSDCDFSTAPERLREGSSGGDDVRFTCSEGSICVEYTVTDASRAQNLRSQCASSSDGHNCSRADAKTCRHENASNGDVSCTVTTSPPDNHDELCSADPAARPGGC